MDLPINKLVLLIIFIVVLFTAAVILLGITLPVGDQINLENQIRQCCQAYRANGCDLDVQISCADGTYMDYLAGKAKYSEEQVNMTCGC